MRITLVLLALAGMVGIGGCGSSGKIRDVEDPHPCMPGWYNDLPEDDDYILTSSSATSRDLQMSVDKAKQSGRAEIGSMFESRIKRLFKEFRNETGRAEDSDFLEMGSDVSKSVVSNVLNGSRVREQKICLEGAVYRAYVMVEMPIGPANEALMSQIRARENYYTEFKASQAFQELEEEVRAYEEWKKAQLSTSRPGSPPPSIPDELDTETSDPEVRRRR